MLSLLLYIVSSMALAGASLDHGTTQIERINVGGSMMRRERKDIKAHSDSSEETFVDEGSQKPSANEVQHQAEPKSKKSIGHDKHSSRELKHTGHNKQEALQETPPVGKHHKPGKHRKHGRQEMKTKGKEKQPVKHEKPAKKGSAAIDATAHTGALVQAEESPKGADTKAASAIEEVASDYASLGLRESEIDPDKNYHDHKHEAFQVKVTGPSGKEVCLSEVHHGYAVRAVKCSGSHGQHWYWHGSHLKNLKSDERCLGYANYAGMKASEGHQLAMYPCSSKNDVSMYTGWKMDEHGRLQSLDTSHCMAFDEEAGHLNAITLPCDP